MTVKYDNEQAEIADLTRQLAEMEGEYQKLQLAIAADPDFAKCRAEVDELRAQVAQLTASLATWQLAARSKDCEIADLRCEITDLKGVQLQAELAKLKAAPPQWKAAIDAGNSRIAEQDAAIERFKVRIAELEATAQTFNANKRAIAQDNIETKADYAVASAVCAALQDQLRAMHIIAIAAKAGK